MARLEKHELSEKELHAWAKREDKARKKKEADEYTAEIKSIVRALTTKGVKLYGWQLEEVKRLVHEAYGRSKLNGIHG